MKTPIIILSYNRPVQLMDMIKSIEDYTDSDSYEIIICDNASQQPEMITLLLELEKKYKVHRNITNMLFEGFNIGLKDVDTPYFIISDPDIILSPFIPSNWIEIFIKFLEKYNVPKIGVALDYNRIPIDRVPALESTYYFELHKQCYDPKYCELFDDPYYEAHTDTTLCMMRRDTYQSWNINEPPQFRNGVEILTTKIIKQRYNNKYDVMPVRVGKNKFMAIHTGWEMMTNERYKSDYEYYIKALKDNKISSTICNVRGENQL